MIQIKETAKNLFNLELSDNTLLKLQEWQKIFVEYNSHTNLMSRGDIPVLFEKHVLDSLSIVLYSGFKEDISLLDLGCGGGFPSVILAVCFPELRVYAMDSVSKKINFISLIKKELNLFNLTPILSRAENHPPLGVDILTSRAVGKIDEVWKFGARHLKKGGSFVSYKALTAHEEAESAVAKYKELKNPLFIPYKLPLKENPTRELVVFQAQ